MNAKKRKTDALVVSSQDSQFIIEMDEDVEMHRNNQGQVCSVHMHINRKTETAL